MNLIFILLIFSSQNLPELGQDFLYTEASWLLKLLIELVQSLDNVNVEKHMIKLCVDVSFQTLHACLLLQAVDQAGSRRGVDLQTRQRRLHRVNHFKACLQLQELN